MKWHNINIEILKGFAIITLSIIFLISFICLFIHINYDSYIFITNNKIAISVVVAALCAYSIYLLYRLIVKIGNTHRFSLLSSIKKAGNAIIILILLLVSTISLQYLCYINNLQKFDTSKLSYQNEITDGLKVIEDEIEYNASFVDKYTTLINSQQKQAQYNYSEKDRKFYAYLTTDTIILTPISKQRFVSTSGIHHSLQNKKHWVNDRRYIGAQVYLSSENYSIKHPYSVPILDSIKRHRHISSNDLIDLFNDKLQFYTDVLNSLEQSKRSRIEIGLSFYSYWKGSLFNKGSLIEKRSHFIVALISSLQILITTFLSGYIFKHLYKVLDGE